MYPINIYLPSHEIEKKSVNIVMPFWQFHQNGYIVCRLFTPCYDSCLWCLKGISWKQGKKSGKDMENCLTKFSRDLSNFHCCQLMRRSDKVLTEESASLDIYITRDNVLQRVRMRAIMSTCKYVCVCACVCVLKYEWIWVNARPFLLFCRKRLVKGKLKYYEYTFMPF